MKLEAPSERERAEFEKWCISRPWWMQQVGWQRENGLWRNADGSYNNKIANDDWITWQAARREERKREQWHFIGRRLPNPNVRVLIALESTGAVTVASWSGESWFDGDESYPRLAVTYWRYMPDYPDKALSVLDDEKP